jgi:hypothetical protein
MHVTVRTICFRVAAEHETVAVEVLGTVADLTVRVGDSFGWPDPTDGFAHVLGRKTYPDGDANLFSADMETLRLAFAARGVQPESEGSSISPNGGT